MMRHCFYVADIFYLTRFSKIAIQATAQMAARQGSRWLIESPHVRIYEIIVYSVLKHINTTRMHTISWLFIPIIDGLNTCQHTTYSVFTSRL